MRRGLGGGRDKGTGKNANARMAQGDGKTGAGKREAGSEKSGTANEKQGAEVKCKSEMRQQGIAMKHGSEVRR